jgi:multiple sugar transport system substrate-binding protein
METTRAKEAHVRVRTIILVAVALVAAACGGGEAEDTIPETTSTTSSEEPVTTTVPVETTQGDSCDPEGMTIELTVLERSAPAAEAGKTALEETHPGLTVDVTVFTTGSYLELAQTVVADAAVDRAPDVIETGLGLVTFVVDGLGARPIDESLLSDTYERRFLEAGTVDGEVYVVPWQVSVPLWFYNKDLYVEAGLDPDVTPSTYEEFLTHARAVAEVTGTESVHMPATLVGDWFFQNAVQAGGGSLIADDGAAAFDTEEGRLGLSLWSTTASEGLHIDVPALDALGLFVQGQIGLFAGSSSVLGTVSGGIEDSFEWGTFIHPTADGVAPSWAIGGAGFSVLSEDPCEMAYSTELIGEILSPSVVAEIGQATGYMPVDTAALPLLEDFYADNPEWDYAEDFDDPLVPWAGWRGERALEVNLVLQDAMLRLTKGEDLATVVAETAAEVDALVGG